MVARITHFLLIVFYEIDVYEGKKFISTTGGRFQPFLSKFERWYVAGDLKPWYMSTYEINAPLWTQVGVSYLLLLLGDQPLFRYTKPYISKIMFKFISVPILSFSDKIE